MVRAIPGRAHRVFEAAYSTQHSLTSGRSNPRTRSAALLRAAERVRVQAEVQRTNTNVYSAPRGRSVHSRSSFGLSYALSEDG